MSRADLLSRAMAEDRKLGIRFAVEDQRPSLLSRIVLPHVGYVIVLRLGEARDVYAIANAIGLVDARQRAGLVNVEDRVGVLSTPGCLPFTIDIPTLAERWRPDEETLEIMRQGSLELPEFQCVVESPKVDGSEQAGLPRTKTAALASFSQSALQQCFFGGSDRSSNGLTGLCLRLFREIISGKLMTVGEAAASAAVSPSMASKSYAELSKRGLVEPLYSPGRYRLYGPTKSGLGLARQMRLPGCDRWAHGAQPRVHDFMVKKIVPAIAKGLGETARILAEGEQFGEARPDITVGIGDLRILVQVAFRNKARYEAEALVRLASAVGATRVVLVAEKSGKLAAIKKAARRAFGDGGIPPKVCMTHFEHALSEGFDWEEFLGLVDEER